MYIWQILHFQDHQNWFHVNKIWVAERFLDFHIVVKIHIELFCRQLKIIKISWNELFLIFISDEISSNASTSHRVSVWLQKISILCFILHGLLILPYFTCFWFMSGFPDIMSCVLSSFCFLFFPLFSIFFVSFFYLELNRFYGHSSSYAQFGSPTSLWFLKCFYKSR